MITPTKHLPLGYSLSDWKWGVYQPCADYFTIAEKFVVDPSSSTGIRYAPGHKRAGKEAGYISACHSSEKCPRNRTYNRIRVNCPPCIDPWAPAKVQKNKQTKGSREANVAAIVWLLTTGNWPPPGFILDHINRDATVNRAWNIRLLDHSGNGQNRTKVMRKVTAMAEPLIAA